MSILRSSGKASKNTGSIAFIDKKFSGKPNPTKSNVD